MNQDSDKNIGVEIRKASVGDLMCIHEMAEVVFRHTQLELNVNRNNPSIGFYQHLGLSILRQGDFHIGNGFYMNDYIMGCEVD